VDEIAEWFLTMVDGFDDSIDELEDHVKDWPSTDIREKISTIRHDILHVRRVLAPTRTTSCCERPTDSTSRAIFSPGCATSTRPRSPTTRTR
jgi:Mg2+ and Co2+ transporter CorA